MSAPETGKLLADLKKFFEERNLPEVAHGLNEDLHLHKGEMN